MTQLKRMMKIKTYKKMNVYFTKIKTVLLPVVMLFCTAYPTFSQEDETLDTEVVNVVKPYTPTISDAFKIKDTPEITDTTAVEKKEVNYTIFSVPVASTFTPAKGKAAKIEKKKSIKIYDNYASLGFGNYTSVLGELFTNFEISRTDNLGVFFKHNSSQGGIKNVIPDNKFYKTALDANYSSKQTDMSYDVNAGVNHHLLNWYGLPTDLAQSFIDELENNAPKQVYLGANLGGTIYFDDSVFSGASLAIDFLKDNFNSSEIELNTKAHFQYPIADFNLKLNTEADYLSGKFKEIPDLEYGFITLGVSPSLELVNDDLSVSLGVGGYFLNNTTNKQSAFYIFPNVSVSYRLVDELLIVYGGAKGGLQQNSYKNITNENPFVSPTLSIVPTAQLYKAYGGIKGKLTKNVGYNLRASYANEEDKAFFVVNRAEFTPQKSYQYGNSFTLVYDNVKTLEIFGELNIAASANLSVGVQASVFSFSLDTLQEAYNTPNMQVSVFSDFTITQKIFGNVSLFYVGERKGLFYVYDVNLPTTKTLKSYLDANFQLGYKHNDRLSFFLKGSNLLNTNYQQWNNYQVQGIQGLAGASYKFDW